MAKEKILIVEDNKALSKLIIKKMQSSLDFDVVSAYTYEEARELVEKDDDYFVALLDLNLPDAPDGEVVDMILSHKIPSIVLTGSMDKEVREAILKKDVIDYVFKGNIDDVNYIFALIERLHKNRGIKVLVVDDSIATRAHIKALLQQQMFTVLVAAHGEEALVFLENNPDIKLILTDFNMPVINGVELTKEVRKRYSKNELSIIAMTATNTELISAKFLKIGANDFINKPFTKEEIACRIHNSLDALEHIAKITQMAQRDFLTGAYNRRYFFETMDAYKKALQEKEEPFALGLIDIDDFKAINDNLGHSVGDMVMVELVQNIEKSLDNGDIVARFGDEKFCVVLKNKDHKKALEWFLKLKSKINSLSLRTKEGKNVGFSLSIGVAFSDGGDTNEMLKQADFALRKAKQNGKNRVEIA
jgi:diguanylate cyclase (GGDEF)-like protein